MEKKGNPDKGVVVVPHRFLFTFFIIWWKESEIRKGKWKYHKVLCCWRNWGKRRFPSLVGLSSFVSEFDIGSEEQNNCKTIQLPAGLILWNFLHFFWKPEYLETCQFVLGRKAEKHHFFAFRMCALDREFEFKFHGRFPWLGWGSSVLEGLA